MTQLRALSAGPCMATQHFTGEVHSAFERACNIALEDGRMLTLLSAELGNVPHGARLDTPREFAFTDLLTAGERVACRGGIARFAAAGLAVRLAGATRWHVRLDDLAADLRQPRVARAWCAARRVAQAHARWQQWRGPCALPVERQEALAVAVGALQSRQAAQAVLRLVGCGPGLTPAGDDLLVGFLAGLRAAAGRDARRRAFLAELSAVVRSAAAETNAVSRAYLEHAADGAFAEPLACLAAGIAEGAERSIVEAEARAALAVGATSGADGVQGLLSALACWRR